jgi:PAS domain S-box-containing protein
MKASARRTALRISIIYALAGAAWILVSDQLLSLLVRELPRLTRIQTYKGSAFILVTAALLYVVLYREFRAREGISLALRASEERYRSIFDNSNDAVLLTAPDGRVLAANREACRIFGMSEEEIRQAGRDGLVDGSDSRLPALQEERARTGRCRGELAFRRKDGTTIPCDVSFARFADRDAALTEILIIRDVTERKQAEAALRQRTRQLEAVRAVSEEITRELNLTALLRLIIDRAVGLVGASAGVIFLWDAERQLLVPRAWHAHGDWMKDLSLRLGEGVTGIAAQRREGMIVNDYRSSAHALPLLLEHVGVTAALAEPLIFRDRLLGAVVVNQIASPRQFTGADQHTLRLFAAQAAIAIENARLFAEAMHAYATLEQAQAQRLESEKLRALGQMSAGIAHDLNNTLAAILGQAELLKLRVADPEILAGLVSLEIAATDGGQVVRRLQDFARQRGATPRASVPLSQVIQQALDLARPRWKDEAQRRSAPIEVASRLEDCPPVQGHASELREALMNLIFNAMDAMPTGGVLTVATRVAKAGWVELKISDTGIGMTEEVRRRIFEPFFTTKGLHGTGLGLSVVYGIVERHGGQIAVESALGKGTTFLLRLPTIETAPIEPGPSTGGARPSPCTLLLIDDETAVRQVVGDLLRTAGHTVFEADSGPAGLRLFQAHAVDCVLTDLGMPEMTGWEVARVVKASRPHVPVILLTGWGEHQQVEPSEANLGKPVRLNELLAAIQTVTASPAVEIPGAAVDPRLTH